MNRIEISNFELIPRKENNTSLPFDLVTRKNKCSIFELVTQNEIY